MYFDRKLATKWPSESHQLRFSELCRFWHHNFNHKDKPLDHLDQGQCRGDQIKIRTKMTPKIKMLPVVKKQGPLKCICIEMFDNFFIG